MRVLIFHGYLLLGTGSNVYNAELGAALVRMGHELHLVCQERSPFALDWVDAAGSWDSGSLVVQERVSAPRATVYRPDLGGLLPVYVADVYDGIQARPFGDLSDRQARVVLDQVQDLGVDGVEGFGQVFLPFWTMLRPVHAREPIF